MITIRSPRVWASSSWCEAVERAEDLQVLAGREQGVQGDLLRHDAEGPARVVGRSAEPAAQEFDLTLVQPHPPGDGADERRLAGAVGAQQQEQLAPFERDLRAVERLGLAESFAGPGDSQGGLHEAASGTGLTARRMSQQTAPFSPAVRLTATS
jgi:hypothetical protein